MKTKPQTDKKDRLSLPEPLEVIEGEAERNVRSWKAAAWAPVVVGLIFVLEEIWRHYFK